MVQKRQFAAFGSGTGHVKVRQCRNLTQPRLSKDRNPVIWIRTRFRRWNEACENPAVREFDPAIAEQKLSRKAREEFCRAPDEVKAVVVEDSGI
jgi:hypothetical protein